MKKKNDEIKKKAEIKKEHKPDIKKVDYDKLDAELMQTFPASDSIAYY